MIDKLKLAKTYPRQPLETVVPLKAPFVLYIDPCGICNFNCEFCPCYRSDYRKEERHTMMSYDLFKKVVDDMEQFEDKVKVVYLYGFGEPLLNRDLPKMARYLKDKNVCREIRMYTNGKLLGPEMNRSLVDSGIDLIRISVEGLSAKQYKEVCKADIDYDLFVDNIRDLYVQSRGKCEVSVKCANVMIKTQEDVDKFLNYYNDISDYTFIEDIVEGWPDFDFNVPKDAVSADNWIWKSKEKGIREKKGFTICTYPLTNMVVYSNGYVSACPADWKFGTQYGDVRESCLRELWESEQLRQLQLMHLKGRRNEIEVCRTCRCCGYDDVDDVADIIISRLES